MGFWLEKRNSVKPTNHRGSGVRRKMRLVHGSIMNELLQVFRSELLIELLEAVIQHIPGLSTRGPDGLSWFE